MEQESKKGDYNNELGIAFEKHSGILLSKILKKEKNTYFNIKFEAIDAIIGIKSKLFAKLPIENDIENEFEIYTEIKELIKICNKYLDKLKCLPKISETANYDNKIKESNKTYLENKLNSSEENKIVHKDILLKGEKKDKVSNYNNNAPKNSDEDTIIVNEPKNNLIQSESEIDLKNLQSGDQVSSCTSNTQKKKKKFKQRRN